MDTSVTTILGLPWYYLIIYLVVGGIMLWLFDKFRIIRSKSARYFIIIIVYSFLFWGIYDLFLA